jgi:hypothetical protein
VHLLPLAHGLGRIRTVLYTSSFFYISIKDRFRVLEHMISQSQDNNCTSVIGLPFPFYLVVIIKYIVLLNVSVISLDFLLLAHNANY